MPEQEPKNITQDIMNRVRLEWIGNYKGKLYTKMSLLRKQPPRTDYDAGNNACLDECLKLLEDNNE